ncbi:unnamed protein product [Peniophora sp. CBMAI 1063]|nr:unnamed protein product [Peniophora sp. CBMAI 1063]
MLHELPLPLLVLLHSALQTFALSLPDESNLNVISKPQQLKPRLQLAPESVQSQIRASNTSSNGTITGRNGTQFVWVLQDNFDHTNFFDEFAFFTGEDPTHGTVTYVDNTTAFNSSLAYVSDRNTVIMKGDNTTWLAEGAYRESVRVSSKTTYNTGLFILDANRAPWGCSVWPAFWTLGNTGTWPASGEIDVIEGVHDNEHNQVTWHTMANCSLTPSADLFSGTLATANYTNCEAGGVDNLPGCGIIEWSQASYGPTFDAGGGGVFAMKWDVDGIAVWNFYRVAVPQDIINGEPDPSNWGTPVAQLAPDNCDIEKYFYNHNIIFDITFCGDWAGNDYATSGCPGTCAQRLMDPTNYNNATWDINWVKVYRRQNIPTVVNASGARKLRSLFSALGLSSVFTIISLLY